LSIVNYIKMEFSQEENRGKPNQKRLESIDFLRGLVIIIMALDHTRDYFHNSAYYFNPEDLSQTNAPLFFTRWITHYCAPVFVFLAGTAVFLQGLRKTKNELSVFLLKRGLWLIMVELLLISLLRTFNPAFIFINLQVIWAIGVSMIFLAAIIRLSPKYILIFSIVLIAGHHVLDTIHVDGNGGLAFCWAVLHDAKSFVFGEHTVVVKYPVLPWIGIMALGYYLGSLYTPSFDPIKRKKILKYLGWGSILLFLILRFSNSYGDASLWQTQSRFSFTIMSFFNVTKYPPSLLYTLMTLGPALLILAFAERPMNKQADKVLIFGRVPMFFYLAHIVLIHLLALPAMAIQGRPISDMVLTTSVVKAPQLKGYGFDLPVVYLVWAAVIVMLYPLCKWFGVYKQKHQKTKKWLSYF